MASSRRRRLYIEGNFTSNGNLTVDRNLTIDCTANCFGVCIYGDCFPSTPFLPTSLPDGSVSENGTTPTNLYSRNRLLPTLIITATTSVAVSFLFLLALYAYIRFRHEQRHRRRSSEANGAVAVNDDDDDLLQGSELEHHIWHIRTQGLDEAAISSIPLFVYRSGDNIVDGRDCSVCLGDFREGELARLLPTCRHAFHLPCIDRWLRSHVNCPLCRTLVVPSATVAVSAPSPDFLSTSYGQIRTEIGSCFFGGNKEIEALAWERSRQGMEIQLTEGSSSGASTSELFHNLAKEKDGLQPIRRSVSMDSFHLDVVVSGERIEDDADREKPVGYLKENARLKLKESAKVEISLSSQSARWFFSRCGRSRNSVLPL